MKNYGIPNNAVEENTEGLGFNRSNHCIHIKENLLDKIKKKIKLWNETITQNYPSNFS